MTVVIAEVAADVLLAEDLKAANNVGDRFNAATNYLQVQVRLIAFKFAEYLVYFKQFVN
jgi:hypothetical protein